MEVTTITMALLMGFTGSLHCAGMCGPIMWIMPFQVFSGFRKILALVLYHLGRISVYAMLAVVLHSFRGLFNPVVQQYISIIMGVSLLAVGAFSFFANNLFHVKLPWEEQIKKRLGNVIGKPGLLAITTAGILNGLLPCGLVYMALSASVMLPSAAQSAAMLYIFGIGTVPMLVSISLLRHKATFLRSANLKKLVPITVFVFGCLFVLRGSNLGIPYLSPKVSMNSGGVHASCCHKK
jgi:sulfite exporter TauE/SafE